MKTATRAATVKSELSDPQLNLSACARVRVRALDRGDEPAWERFVLNHPKASIFHQLGWKRVMEKTYGYRSQYFVAERNGQLTGISPSFFISGWVTGRCLISLPFAVYGGVCADDLESEQALLNQLEQLAISERVEYLELRNRNGHLLPGYHANLRYATFTLPLVEDSKAIFNAFPKDIRYMIRKAEKAGLTSRRGLDQIESFYRLLTDNLRRLGTPAFPRALFEHFISEYPGQVDLMLVYANSEPVAGSLSFFFRDSMQPYYVGATEVAKTVAANNFLWWEMIKYAAETGHTTFDFGRSKIGSGNFDFKKKWKPQIETLGYQVRLIERETVPNFSPTNPKFELATRVWRRLPLGLTRVIGPHVVRWFP